MIGTVVKKAVNWALRGIGKRNKALNKLAVETASALHIRFSCGTLGIANDAMRELTSDCRAAA